MIKPKPPLRQGSSNDFQTPKWAIKPLLPYLDNDKIVWECACGKGNLVDSFYENGIHCIGTDILEGHDFLEKDAEFPYSYIVTNPPYSLKQQFLERCYKLGKPFALLLPLTTFETGKRQRLFEEYGLQVIFFDKRINFETPTGKTGKQSSSWFATAWFTNGLNLRENMIFVKLDSIKDKNGNL